MSLSNVFCTNSFTGFSLGQNLSLKFLPYVPCENERLSGVLMSSYVIALSCITLCEGIPESLFIYIAIHIYIIYYIACRILHIAFNVFFFSIFHRNLISCITRSLHKRKTFIEFRPQNGSFSLPVTTFRV